jgi:hypothetical protein
MPQVSAGGDAIANELFEFLDLGEAPLACSGPYSVSFDSDLEHAANAWDQCEFADIGREGRQEFLSHPCGSEQPAALGTVLDLDSRRLGHHRYAV